MHQFSIRMCQERPKNLADDIVGYWRSNKKRGFWAACRIDKVKGAASEADAQSRRCETSVNRFVPNALSRVAAAILEPQATTCL
jgi:hypothetical protein